MAGITNRENSQMARNDNPIIKLEDVWKVYQLGRQELAILKGISLEIKRGDFIAVLGPSGSGKSTLLHMLGCLDLPTRGKIYLDNRDISLLSEDEIALVRGQKIGFIFQQFNLLQNLTALENVILPMIFSGKNEKERRERAEELLSWVGLKERLGHRPTEMSGGEQQRVAISRALANNPEIIVADEPTGNLDSVTGERVMQTLADFNEKDGKTVIVVTHDMEVANHTKRIIHIKDGQIA
jgi:putative ABC transport system ATP-binding protein